VGIEDGFNELEMLAALRVFGDFSQKGLVDPNDFYASNSMARRALSLSTFMTGGNTIASASSPDDLRASVAAAETVLLKLAQDIK
jgi:hypothetical protein